MRQVLPRILVGLLTAAFLCVPAAAWAQGAGDAPAEGEPAAEPEGDAEPDAQPDDAKADAKPEGAAAATAGDDKAADPGDGDAKPEDTPDKPVDTGADPKPGVTAPPIELPPGATPEQAKEIEAFQKSYLRYEREIGSYRREVGRIVQSEYDQRRAEIEAVYDKEIRGLEILERERRDEAIAAFEEFLRKYPNNPRYSPDVIYRLAELYFEKANDDYLLADERYQRQLELFELGRIADEPESPGRNYDKTIALFQRLITDFPEYRYIDGGYYLLGFCLLRTEQDKEAKAAFEDLIRLRPDSRFVAEAWVRIGEYHFDFNELDEAISAYSQALNFPENAYYDKALYKLAWAYYRADRFEEAIQTFKDLVQYADNKKAETGKSGSELREEAIQYLAISLSEEDWNNDGIPDEDFGMARVTKYLSGDEPYNREVLVKLADILFDNTRYDESVKVYRMALNRYPLAAENPKYHDKLIIALERLRLFDEAVEERRKIGEYYGPGSDWFVHQEKEGNQEALAFARDLAKNNLIDSATWYHEQAQKLAQEAVDRSDPNLEIQAKERFAIAAQTYGTYLDAYPHDREAYKWQFYQAECLFYSGQFEPAAEAYSAVRELNSGDNKFRENSAFNAIKAYEFSVQAGIARGEFPKEALPESANPDEEQPAADGSDGGNGGGRDEPIVVAEPIEIPELVGKMNAARERYVELGLQNQDKKLPGKLEFQVARVFYDFNHLEEARTRFERIIGKYEGQDVAIFAATLILQSYVDVEDYENMALWADRIASNPKLANGAKAAEIRKEAERLKLGATFKAGERLLDEKKYEEAAEKFVAVVNANPKNEYADDALINAAVAYETVKRYESASKLYKRVYQEYPDSTHAPKALFRVAFNAERFFDYDQAVRSYLLLTDRYKGDEKREVSLRRAGVILENTQDYEKAAATYIRFATEFPDSEDAPVALYQAALVYEKMGDVNRMIRTLNDFRSRFGRDPAYNFQVMQGLDKIATHYWEKARDQRTALKYFKDIEREYIVRGIAPGSREAAFAAKARFFQVEVEFAAWDKIQVRGTLKQQTAALKKKIEGAKRLRPRYESVYEYRALEWVMAAGYRSANIQQRFAQALYDAEVPFDEESDEYYLYKTKLEDLAVPLEDAAVADYEKVLARAREDKIVNDWTKKALTELNKYKPSEFPLFHEEKIEMTPFTTTPLGPATPTSLQKGTIAAPEEELIDGSDDEEVDGK
jgi:cellulose synthase operon protein C